MNSKSAVEGKSKDLKRVEVMEDKKNINRSDAGEPGKENFSKAKDVKISNYVKAKDSFSKPDWGDIVVEKNRENKIESQAKDTKNILTKANETKTAIIKKAEASKDKMKLLNSNNLRETKYNKIMESINKIIEENIHFINTNAKSTDRKVVNESSKVAGESNINKQDTKLKEPEKQYKDETAKEDDKALVNFRKKIDCSKAPLDVVTTSNDVKNKSLVINLPKQASGCKIQDKPKVSKDQVSPKPILNSFQRRKVSQTTENCGVKPTRNIINNNKSTSAKIQAEKPKMLKTDSTIGTDENRNNHKKKSTLHNAKVKHVKRKNVKKNESPKNGSQTKLIPMLEDEHAKLYYEAWLNNTVTVTAQEQQILEDAAQRCPSEPVITEMASENYTDKKFTGTIKIKYGKDIKQSCKPGISIK